VGRSEVYKRLAAPYDLLCRRQDVLHRNIAAALRRLLLLDGDGSAFTAADLGTGTGKLADVLLTEAAPRPRVVFCIDRAQRMLSFAAAKRRASRSSSNGHLGAAGEIAEFILADNRALPLRPGAVDAVVAGWTLSEIKSAHFDGRWRSECGRALAEMARIARRRVVILETLGCGCTEPMRSGAHLYAFLERPEDGGFVRECWVRSDYAFDSEREAHDMMRFFFGGRGKAQPVPVRTVLQDGRVVWVVPECTGIWTKSLVPPAPTAQQ